MTAAEVAQLCVGVATLVSAVASLVLAFRGHDLAVSTHALVNGQSENIQALREAKGHAEGLIAGVGLGATSQAPADVAQTETPTHISLPSTPDTGNPEPAAS